MAHVTPTLRFAYRVEGRPDVLTERAAYKGSVKAAIAKRCDCYEGSGAPDDPSEVCEYHAVLMSVDIWGDDGENERRRRVLKRLESIHRAQDAASDDSMLDLSRMTKAQLETILVAVDWHLAHGSHR